MKRKYEKKRRKIKGGRHLSDVSQNKNRGKEGKVVFDQLFGARLQKVKKEKGKTQLSLTWKGVRTTTLLRNSFRRESEKKKET